jgi:hypothetical protein
MMMLMMGGGRSGVVSDISYVVGESRIQTSVETDSKIKLGCQAVKGRAILQVSLKTGCGKAH